MSTWNQGYPQGPPPPGFQYPQQPGGFPQGGYPPPPGYPPQAGYPSGPYPGGFAPGAPPVEPFPPPYASPHPAMYGGDPEYQAPEGDSQFDFTDRTVRHGFIRKVYGILMCQLLVTLGFIVWFLYHEPTRKFVRENSWVWWVAFAFMLVTMICIACCGNIRRKAPMNFIFLGVFTLAESFMLASAASYFQSQEVLLAVGITAVVCLALTIFAFQTKWDFTMMGGVLFVAVIILMLFGLIAMFVHTKVVTLIYGCLGALIFSVYLIYDTQMMMGGKHKFSISPEEYIFAALNLYIDIVQIFMYVLTIIGASRD